MGNVLVVTEHMKGEFSRYQPGDAGPGSPACQWWKLQRNCLRGNEGSRIRTWSC